MSSESANEGEKSSQLKCSFFASDDSRSVWLMAPSGLSVCLIYAGGESGSESVAWLGGFLKERFDRIFSQPNGASGEPSLVSFFQTAHADLFKERTKRPRDLAQISLVAAHVHENSIEIASVGTCAAYRVSASGVERIIPSESNGVESCYLGASLKVSVEMVKRSLSEAVSYVLTSKRVDLNAGWEASLVEALRLAGTDSGSAVHTIFDPEGGAFATLESETAVAARESQGEALSADVSWYKRLREEAVKPSAVAEHEKSQAREPATTSLEEGLSTLRSQIRKNRLRWLLIKGAPLAALIVIAGASIYAFWVNGGRDRIVNILGTKRSSGKTVSAGNTMRTSLSLNSIPSGAEIVLDDSLIASRTPASVIPVSPGTHQVAMRLGELGQWTGSVAVEPGHTTNLNVAFMGEIAVDSRPQEGLSVILDGAPRGYTPCVLESVPAGLHIVKVEGQGFSPWEEEVMVTQDAIAEVQVIPGKLPGTGTIRITAGHVSEEGYEESNGRGVFIDGRRVGVTPLKIDLKPGYHSVRVAGTKGEVPSVSVIQVRPGGKHFIRAEFAGSQPILVESMETRAPATGQAIICASLSGNTETQVSKVELYLEKLDSAREGWEKMVLVPGSSAIYSAAVPQGLASGGERVKYFVRVTTPEGLEYFSDVATLTTR